MCLATPVQIKEINKMTATVNHAGKDFEVSLQLIPKAKKGDWILTHGEMAINIIPESQALDILDLIRKSNCSC
jgi:hydrogenase expression/formation protein HypC